MKKKSISMEIVMILFAVSVVEFLLLAMNIKVPHIVIYGSMILLVIVSFIEYIKTKEFRQLIYPLTVIYFLLVIPYLGKIILNTTVFLSIVIISFGIVIMILYNDFKTGKKSQL